MTDSQQGLGVAVIGVGRMGRHHARTWSKIPGAKLWAVVDADEERAATVADTYGCASCTSVAELLERFPQVRAASVAVPTRFHLDAARPLIERGVSCLVEKPLALSLEQGQELVDLAAKHGVTLAVGHTERFNPAVRAVSRMNITPRYMEIHRVSPMTFRSLDVGVVMDMMIHDLDIVLALAKSELASVEATGLAVLGEHEDVASARLVFASGCVASVTASRLALKTERKLRLFSEAGYVSLDYQQRSGMVIRKSANESALADLRAQLAGGKDLSDVDYANVIHVEELAMDTPADQVDPLTDELTSFAEAVRTGSPPEVDGRAGLEAVRAAQAVVRAIGEHRWEGLESPRV